MPLNITPVRIPSRPVAILRPPRPIALSARLEESTTENQGCIETAAKANCYVTSSEADRGAYGIRVDNDESVYFPLGLTEALELVEFEEVEAILIKNDRPEPTWKAIRARFVEESRDRD